MYIPAAFRETRLDVLHALIRQYSFGTLVSIVEGEPFATHLPFLFDAERGTHGTLVGHLARATPHWRSFSPSLAIFQGPHAYISPNWYVAQQAVPTWNYAVVHAYGTPVVIDDPRRTREILERLVGTFESGRPAPWSTTRLDESFLATMQKAIVAFEMPLTRLEGKTKLSQNRPSEDAAGAIAGLCAEGGPLEQETARLMEQALTGAANAAPPRG